MTRTTVRIEGMMCGMCEAHVSDAIRAAFPVKKVTASHGKGTATIVSEQPIDLAALRQAIDATGYTYVSADAQPFEKRRGLFRRR